MKFIYTLIIAAAIVGCQRSENPHNHDSHEANATESDSTNLILYNEVDDIHMEAMEKMEALYNRKKEFQEKLKTASDASKQKIEARIAELDSASIMMEDWMHEFNPPADTTDKEQVRAYLEAELEKVKRLRDAMNQALREEEN